MFRFVLHHVFQLTSTNLAQQFLQAYEKNMIGDDGAAQLGTTVQVATGGDAMEL